jgi:hypothetical protein
MKRLHEAKVALLPRPLTAFVEANPRTQNFSWLAGIEHQRFSDFSFFLSVLVTSKSCPKIAEDGKILKYNVNDEREPK